MKNVKGITLIALVITIVVLIILAGVAISLSLGENGIFNKAKFATEEYANEQAREEAEIAKYSNDIDTIVNTRNDISNVQVKSLISTNDPIYNQTDKGFVFSTPTTYTPITTNNVITVNDNLSNYDYLIFEYDCYVTSSSSYPYTEMKIAKVIEGKTLVLRYEGLANYQQLAYTMDLTNNTITIGSGMSTTSGYTKICIKDIKGIKL